MGKLKVVKVYNILLESKETFCKLNSDFSGIMMKLQNIEEIDVEELIENAIQIRKELNEKYV